MVIDFHTHTFPEKISARVMEQLGTKSCVMPATNGAISGLKASMAHSQITYSLNLPVMTTTKQVTHVNENLIQSMDTLYASGILTFGGMHPDFTDYKKELKHLADSGIKGIKLHPAYQQVDLDDIRMFRIISYASELGLITVLHTGIDIGIYDHNYASVAHILKLLKEVNPQKLVLAHMGNWACWDDVERDLLGAPVWLDSAFTIGPITPYPDAPATPYGQCVLSDDAFVRIAKKHGMNRVLFATDSPWQEQKRYLERFRSLPFTKEEQDLFFYKNAADLLQLPV